MMGGIRQGKSDSASVIPAEPAEPAPPFNIVTLLHSLINHSVMLHMDEGNGRVGYIRSVHHDYIEVERSDKTSYFRISSIYQVDVPRTSKVDK